MNSEENILKRDLLNVDICSKNARTQTVPRMATMTCKMKDSPNFHKGRFLWMDPLEQKRFLEVLKSRIDSGYYYSDSILSKVADELTPVLSEITGEG